MVWCHKGFLLHCNKRRTLAQKNTSSRIPKLHPRATCANNRTYVSIYRVPPASRVWQPILIIWEVRSIRVACRFHVVARSQDLHRRKAWLLRNSMTQLSVSRASVSRRCTEHRRLTSIKSRTNSAISVDCRSVNQRHVWPDDGWSMPVVRMSYTTVKLMSLSAIYVPWTNFYSVISSVCLVSFLHFFPPPGDLPFVIVSSAFTYICEFSLDLAWIPWFFLCAYIYIYIYFSRL